MEHTPPPILPHNNIGRLKFYLGSSRPPKSCLARPLITLDLVNPRGIIWLASYPKSGNTWIRSFLFALERIRAGAEIDAVNLDEVVYWGETDRDVDYFARYLKAAPQVVDRTAIAAVRPMVQRDIALGTPHPVYIKTHNARISDRGHPTINPAATAGAIYIIRNPLDVAISWARFRRVSIDEAIADMARSDFETQTNEHDVYMVYRSWSEHVRSWTGHPDATVLTVRYEDLLTQGQRLFAQIASHLMIFCLRQQSDRAAELAAFGRLQAAEIATGFLEKPPDVERFFREGRAGQWREVLTTAQVDRVLSVHAEEMARFGYLPA